MSEDLSQQISKTLKNSISAAFSTLFSLETEISDIFNNSFNPDIIGSIGFSGTMNGTIAICLSKELACNIVSKMLGMEITELDADVTDGTGEILNMIIGGLKTRIIAINHDIEISIPSVVTGQDLMVQKSTGSKIINLSVKVEDIAFQIILFYKLPQQENKIEKPIKEKKVDASSLLSDIVKSDQ